MPPFTTLPETADGVAALEQAARRRYRWPFDVIGFDADVECCDRTVRSHHTVAITADEDGVGVSGDLPTWAACDLAAIAQGLAYQPPHALLPNDPIWACQGARGIEVWVADEHDSRYILRDGRVVEVHRTLPDAIEHVSFEQRATLPDGRELPTRMRARHHDPVAGTLCGAAVYRGTFAFVDDVAVPVRRALLCTTAAGDTARSLTLHDHRVHRA